MNMVADNYGLAGSDNRTWAPYITDRIATFRFKDEYKDLKVVGARATFEHINVLPQDVSRFLVGAELSNGSSAWIGLSDYASHNRIVSIYRHGEAEHLSLQITATVKEECMVFYGEEVPLTNIFFSTGRNASAGGRHTSIYMENLTFFVVR